MRALGQEGNSQSVWVLGLGLLHSSPQVLAPHCRYHQGQAARVISGHACLCRAGQGCHPHIMLNSYNTLGKGRWDVLTYHEYM